MKRAVITGLGIVSSIGNNQQEVLASLREGRSGITFSQELKDSGMRSHVWGNVKLDTTGLIDRKVVRFMSDASIYAYLSMEQAVADAGLAPEAYQNNPRVRPDRRLRRRFPRNSRSSAPMPCVARVV